MLTADLITPRLRWTSTTLTIELLDEQDAQWHRIVCELIDLLHSQVGCSFASWTQALETYIGDSLNYVVMRGLAKVLSDAATFAPPPTHVAPTVIRERLFSYGPVFEARDVFHTQTHSEVVQDAAAELGISKEQVEAALFADRPSHTILTDAGPAWTPADLLARYNLELTRGVLYWASQLRIDVAGSYKDLWKYLKLFKLMFWATQEAEGYHLELDGPISPFVHATTRYGRAFAAFMPALLLCERWRLAAQVHPPVSFTPLTYRLDSTSSLRSHFKRSGLFDSRLEADFAGEFEEKFGGKRGHWLLTRESEVLLLGDTVMIPDFVLVDKQDETRKILIELVGFWHPNYLRRKVEKVRAAHCSHLLLLVYEGLNLAPDAFQDTESEVIFFPRKPVVREVMEAVEAMAERVYGPRAKREKRGRAKKGRVRKRSKELN
jgi:predicted nuclease of restriction endonuclease-like RecB superfamily